LDYEEVDGSHRAGRERTEEQHGANQNENAFLAPLVHSRTIHQDNPEGIASNASRPFVRTVPLMEVVALLVVSNENSWPTRLKLLIP
jgi:hypothetical protein